MSSGLHHSIGSAGAGLAPSAAVLQERVAPAPRRLLPSYAAIDLGTNNCRLLIARRAGSAFRVIDALKVCADKIGQRKVAHGRYVATEACRRAENCGEFLAQVKEAIGIELE